MLERGINEVFLSQCVSCLVAKHASLASDKELHFVCTFILVDFVWVLAIV